MVNFCFVFTGIFFYLYILSRKDKILSAKEFFSLGLFTYTFLPFIILYFFQDFLFSNYDNFFGYNSETLEKIQIIVIVSIFFFLFGYHFHKKKINFISNKNSISQKVLLLSFFLSTCIIFFPIQYIESVINTFLLLCLLIYKTKITDKKKIAFIIISLIIFQYLSSSLSGARRDLIKLLIISIFFISLLIQNKKKIILMLFLLVILTVYFILLTTLIRSNLLVEDVITMNKYLNFYSLLTYFDFMHAFDNFIYIVETKSYLYGASLFKIFFAWIPREIWPEKPVDVNILLTTLHKNKFVGGTSYSLNLLGEVYWNIGFYSIVIFNLLLGIFIKNIDLNYKNNLSDLQLLLYPTFSFLMFTFWRGAISTQIINYIINIIFIFCIIYISRFLLRIRL